MIFSDRDIRRLLADGTIQITPAPDLSQQLGSCSLDLRLSNTFSIFNDNTFSSIDTREPVAHHQVTREVIVADDGRFVLQPGAFALAVTVERVELPDDIVARLEGRSSLGRLGIIVHATASIIDPGWRGQIVLELGNHGTIPVALYPGMRICALTFEPVSTPVDVPYWAKARAKYAEQTGPISSRIAEDANTNADATG